MPYNRAATKSLTELVGLAARTQRVVDHWFSLWDGDQLPDLKKFGFQKIRAERPYIMMHKVVPDVGATIVSFGKELVRMIGLDPTGADWIALAPSDLRTERLRRSSAVARGAILRITREAPSGSEGGSYFFEAVALPLRPRSDGTVPVLNFIDWNPPPGTNPLPADAMGRVPEIAEFIPIVVHLPDAAADDATLPERPLKPEERIKLVSRGATRLLLNFLSEGMNLLGDARIDPVDYIIAIAIGSANVSHIDTDPALSRKYAGLVEPDWMRRGISRAAISRATNIPLETVRRRINGLIEAGILIERDDGVVLPSANRLKIGSGLDAMRSHTQLFDRMMRDLKARGVEPG